MVEPKDDMLPDEEGTRSDVEEDTKSPVKDVKQEQKPKSISPPPEQGDSPAEEVKPKESKGIPYSRYKEKVKELKEAKRQLKTLKESPAPSEEYEEETDDVASVKEELKELRKERDLDRVLDKKPILTEKLDEFEEYMENNPNLTATQASVLFLDEQGVSEGTDPPGLEKPTSGPREPQVSGFTPDQVEELRKTQPRRYERMLQEGKFDDVAWDKTEGSFGG